MSFHQDTFHQSKRKTYKEKLKISIGDKVDYGYGKGIVTYIRNNANTGQPEQYKVNGKFHNANSIRKIIRDRYSSLKFRQEEKRGKEIIIKGRMGLQDYTAGDGSKKVHEYSEPFITDVLDRLIEIVKPTMVLPEYVNKVSDYEILGTIISKYVKWNSVALLEIFESASEDSNFSVIEIVFPKLPKNIQANLLKTGKHKRR